MSKTRKKNWSLKEKKIVQVARQWHMKFEEEILKLGYLKDDISPFIFLKIDECTFCLFSIYVDNGNLTEEINMINETIKGLEKVSHIKTNKSIEDFLGCETKESTDRMMLTRRRIINKLIKDNNVINNNKMYKTPSFKIVARMKRTVKPLCS
jgi:hypothetical protein